MKRTITHLLLLLLLSVSSSVMAGDVVTVNGVKYQGLTDDSEKNVVAAEVTGAEPLKDGILTIADSVTISGKKLPVTNIGDSAFCSREDICQVEFPSSLKKIGNFVFSSCTNLKSISLPDNVETLGEHAFRDCVRLESVVFSEKITMIPSGCFLGCMSLKELNLPSNLRVFR